MPARKGARKGRHQQAPWREDPDVLARMQKVERLHLAGRSSTDIAAELGIGGATARRDIRRLTELWLERVQDTTEARRARRLAELEDIRLRSLAAAEFDESCEKAVLFGTEFDPELGTVRRDDKGSAQFRGNKAAALGVARAAIMDSAKLEGLVIDKKSLTDEEGKGLDLASILAEAKEIVGGSSGAGSANPQPVV